METSQDINGYIQRNVFPAIDIGPQAIYLNKVIKITTEGMYYHDQYIADAGEAHALLLKALRICV